MALCHYCGGLGRPDAEMPGHYQRRHPTIASILLALPERWPDGRPLVYAVSDYPADTREDEDPWI